MLTFTMTKKPEDLLYPLPQSVLVPMNESTLIDVEPFPHITQATRKFSAHSPCNRKQISETLLELGFKEIGNIGSGRERIAYSTNGPFVLVMSYENPGRLCCDGMIQPLVMPFEIGNLYFELLPYVLPISEAKYNPAYSNLRDKINLIDTENKLVTESKKNFLVRDSTNNMGLLLNGNAVFIDPQCLERSVNTTNHCYRSLDDFWRADTAQHAHVKALGLEYGVWPKQLKLLPQRIGQAMDEAGRQYTEEKKSGTPPSPLCHHVRRIVANKPIPAKPLNIT